MDGKRVPRLLHFLLVLVKARKYGNACWMFAEAKPLRVERDEVVFVGWCKSLISNFPLS